MDKMNTVAFAYRNNPEILKISSSGGAFLGIAKIFAEKAEGMEYSIYGARWTKDLEVVHSKVNSFEESKIFCGSKYIQSYLGTTFQEVVDDLCQNKVVLFTGTPCQIAALKKFVDRQGCCNAERLLLVDIACHGTPVASVWNDYKSWLEKQEGSSLKEFSFRYKPKGWKGYPALAVFENGKRYENSFQTSHYMTMFRKDLLMKKSCFNCKYPGNYQSDITIADFWGVELCMPQLPTEYGVSLLLCHTERGKEIAKEMKAIKVPDDNYLNYNQNLSRHTEKPTEYDLFWREYREFGFEYVLRGYGGNTVKGKIYFNSIRLLRDSGIMAFAKKLLKKA